MAAPCVVYAGDTFTTFRETGEWTLGSEVSSVAIYESKDPTKTYSRGVRLKEYNTITTGYFTRTSGMAKTFSAGERACMALDVWANLNDQLNYDYYTDNGTTVVIEFSSTTDFSKNFSYTTNGLHSGWTRVLISEAMWTNTGGESWANSMIRMRVGITSARLGQRPTIAFDNLYTSVQMTPSVVIHFDDGYSSVYNSAYPKMASLGFKGTLYAPSDYLGTTNYMTWDQTKTLYDAGWTIGSHCPNHDPMYGQQRASARVLLEAAATAYAGHGMTLAPHIAYPYGYWSLGTLQAMEDVGFLTGRTINHTYQGVPVENDNHYLLHCRYVNTDYSLATVEGWVDTIEASGATLILLFHDIGGSGGGGKEWTVANFETLMDYIDASGIAVKTMAEWYAFASVQGAQTATSFRLGTIDLNDQVTYFVMNEGVNLGQPQTTWDEVGTYGVLPNAQVNVRQKKALIPITLPMMVKGTSVSDLNNKLDALWIEVDKASNTLAVGSEIYELGFSTRPDTILRDPMYQLGYIAEFTLVLTRKR